MFQELTFHAQLINMEAGLKNSTQNQNFDLKAVEFSQAIVVGEQ